MESLKRTISDPTRISVSYCGITQKGAKKCYLARSFPYKRVGSTGAPGSARLCPAVPGFARPCESSRPDSKPTPHAQVLWKAVAWQSTNSLKLLLLLLRAILPLRAVQNPVGDPLRAVQTPVGEPLLLLLFALQTPFADAPLGGVDLRVMFQAVPGWGSWQTFALHTPFTDAPLGGDGS